MADEDRPGTDTYDPRGAAVGFAATFAVLTVLQALALAAIQEILDDPARMSSLRWSNKAGVYLDRALHVGHLVGSVLGIVAAGLLLRSRRRSERVALLPVAFPILLSTMSWCTWIFTHLDDMARHYGPGIVFGLLGLLAGLLCPVVSFMLVIAGRERIRPGWGGALVCFCLAILVWTVATLVETIPIVMAIT